MVSVAFKKLISDVQCSCLAHFDLSEVQLAGNLDVARDLRAP